MSRIRAELVPVPRDSKRKDLGEPDWWRYNVIFQGEQVVTLSTDPEHDLARALHAKGISDGAVEVWCSGRHRSTVNIAAARDKRTDAFHSPIKTVPIATYHGPKKR